MLTDAERQLTTERQLKFQGTAKIELDQISLQPLMSREIDQKNVERLREIFAKDGCQRLDIRNHVTAIVSKRHLRRACHATGLTPAELKSRRQQNPRLYFSGRQVQCLHGQHRLKAAEETLAPSDRWWTVDLYLDGLNFPTHDFFICSNPHSQTSAQIFGLPSSMNMQTKNLQPMGKSTGKSVSISMRATRSFKTAGGPDCRRTKPSGYDSSLHKTMHTSVQHLTRYLRSPDSGTG